MSDLIEVKLMTLKDTTDQLRDMTLAPLQWPVLIENAESMLEQGGFNSLTEYITEPWSKGGLGITLEKAKTLLYLNPAYTHKADDLCQKLGIAEKARGVPILNANGGDRKQSTTPENSTLKIRGTTSDYRISKLKRDHPEIAERLMQGEFKTVRDAERAAGVIPTKPEIKRIELYPDDPARSADKLRAAFGDEWLKDVSQS
jgi:hypothetical protein